MNVATYLGTASKVSDCSPHVLATFRALILGRVLLLVQVAHGRHCADRRALPFTDRQSQLAVYRNVWTALGRQNWSGCVAGTRAIALALGGVGEGMDEFVDEYGSN
nr:hypothetical protein CFP56_12379 [Quercus suber]